jgi:AsmA-like C-terminal region
MHPNDEVNTMQERRSLRRRFRWIVWIGGLLLLLLVVVTVTGVVLARRVEPFLRARIVDGLSQHFHARVELDSFHVSIGNSLRGEWGIWAEGHGLRIWPPAEVAGVAVPIPARQGEPLFSLASFGFHAPLRYKLGTPIAVSEVRLQGLELHLPPRSHFLHLEPPAGGSNSTPANPDALHIQFQLGSVSCTGAHLVLETSKPGKVPMEIFIEHFRLTNIQPNAAMNFDAELTNPRPVGSVHTKGTFGPWQVWDPGLSPVAGDYSFEHANLGDFKGIGGYLSSNGDYQGTLRNITVDGQTDTPDFNLTHFGNPMDLKTRFHAIVDGTNGDTWLDPVNATLGHSQITARGQVVRVFSPASQGPQHGIGHDIELKIETDHGRIEDFLHLANHSSTPLLTGDVTLRSTLHIPPGPAPVHERMGLKGAFTLAQAQFTSPKVQERIEELSLRGQGKPKEAKSGGDHDVQSEMKSDFQIAGGVITLPNLVFDVPGADIELNGTYTLAGGALDFKGVAKLQATISKLVGGWKGFLLKPADRFFKKDGAGTEVPIHIDGTYKDPHFGVDVKGAPHSHPQRPDQQPQTSPSPSPETPPQS